MAISLEVAGKTMKIKVFRGQDFELHRDSIKKLADKKPIYKLQDGVSRFSHWEVPILEFGNLLNYIAKEKIVIGNPPAQELLDRFVADSAGVEDLPLIEDEIKWKRPPRFEDQETYIRLNRAKKRLIGALSPGMGKSFCSLMRAQVSGGKKILVVGPSKNNFVTWRSEVELSTDWTFVKYHGTPAKRKKLRAGELDKYDVIFTTYTMVHELVGIKFDQIIFDEAHTICHKSTKVFKNAEKLVKSCPEAGLQLLSGTPILHKPRDLWALVYLINPIVAGSEYSWIKRYEKVEKSIFKNVPIKTSQGYALDERGRIKTRKIEIPIVVVNQNMPDLYMRTKSFLYRRKLSDHVSFKDRMEIQLVEMLPRQLKMYQEAKEQLMIELSDRTLNMKNALSRVTRFMQICEGCYNLDPTIQDSGKLEYLFDELDNADDKRLIWSRFLPSHEILKKKYGKRMVVSNGTMTPIQRSMAIWNFQGCVTDQDYADWEKYNKGEYEKPGQAQFLHHTIDRGSSVGLNIPSCSKQYCLSPTYNGNINEQAFSRLKRLTQQADEVYTEIILTEVPHTRFEENVFKKIMINYAVTLDALDGEDNPGNLSTKELINLI